MKTKTQERREEEDALRAKVRDACGVTHLSDWSVLRKDKRIASIHFRVDGTLTLATLQRLSDALGTTAINFNFGDSGEPGYSEMTPGTEGSPGWIEVLFP